MLAAITSVAIMFLGPQTAGALLGVDGPEGEARPMYITVQPDPLVEGQQGKVCYDFAGSGQTQPVELKVTWIMMSGPDIVTTVTVDPKSPCHAITPPLGAASVNILDSTGVSPDYGGAIAPPPEPIE